MEGGSKETVQNMMNKKSHRSLLSTLPFANWDREGSRLCHVFSDTSPIYDSTATQQDIQEYARKLKAKSKERDISFANSPGFPCAESFSISLCKALGCESSPFLYVGPVATLHLLHKTPVHFERRYMHFQGLDPSRSFVFGWTRQNIYMAGFAYGIEKSDLKAMLDVSQETLDANAGEGNTGPCGFIIVTKTSGKDFVVKARNKAYTEHVARETAIIKANNFSEVMDRVYSGLWEAMIG